MACKCGPKVEEFIKEVGELKLKVKITSKCEPMKDGATEVGCCAIYTIENDTSSNANIIEFDAGPDDKNKFSPAIARGNQDTVKTCKKGSNLSCEEKHEGKLYWQSGSAATVQEFGNITICMLKI